MRQTKVIRIRISTREHLQHTEQGRESTRPVLLYPPPGARNPNQTNLVLQFLDKCFIELLFF